MKYQEGGRDKIICPRSLKWQKGDIIKILKKTANYAGQVNIISARKCS